MIIAEKLKILIFFLSHSCNAQLELEENLVPASSDNLWSLSLTTEGTPLTTTTAEQSVTTERYLEKSTRSINENIEKTTTIQVLDSYSIYLKYRILHFEKMILNPSY